MSVKRQSIVLVLMIALGLAFAVSFFTSAQSQSVAATSNRGPYMIAGGDKLIVWRIDQSTGQVSYCMRDTVSTDPRYLATYVPYCSAWSK